MYLALILIVLIMLMTVAWAGLSFAPWVPTWKSDIKRAANLVKLKKQDVFYDLGCGTGGVVFYFNKKFECQGKGVEIAIPFYLIAKIRSFFYKRVKIELRNLFKVDLKDANVIFLFGTAETVGKKLVSKLKKELKPGTQVISYIFPLKGIKAIKVDKPKNKNALYLYQF